MERNNAFKNEERRRGRPAGKNRVPLSVEERRARNAQYERERRVETAGAMADLAQALGCEETISNADILATAIQELQKAASRDPSDDIFELRRVNAKLIQQIEDIEKRLTNVEDRIETQPKKNSVVKAKIKKKKAAKTIQSPPVPVAMEADHPSANQPTEAAACDEVPVIVAEPLVLTDGEPFLLDSITMESPVNDWGIDDLISEYLDR